jgi:OOP family OmpA-OmpF porin
MTTTPWQAQWRWVAAVCLAFVGCAAAQPTPEAGVSAPLGKPYQVPRLLSKQQSRVVFYRLATDDKAGVASVYVNGEYQGSLLPGGFTQLCMAPRSVEVAVRTVDNSQELGDAYDVTNSLMLEAGQDVFVRVSHPDKGRALMLALRPETALPELVKTRTQQHTLSRVTGAQVCTEDPSRLTGNAATGPVRMQTITLEGDALFAFGKSDVESISPKGRRMLDHLIDRIKTEFGTGGRAQMLIVGHADGFGTEQANLRLSKKRALAIKLYFVRGGLPAERIKTEGRGDSQPVVKDCGKQFNEANVACNKPNRRVVVTVLGTPVSETNK